MWCPLATALLWLASGAGGLVPSARHPSASTRPRAPARLSRLFDAASVSVMPVDAARNGTAVKAKDAGPKFLFSPPMTLAKYDTMRKKRVRVVISYTGGEMWAYKHFLRVKRIFQQEFPDCILNREISGEKATGVFDIFVDQRLVYMKQRDRAGTYLSMRALNAAIVRARRMRRPNQIVYGDSTHNMDTLASDDAGDDDA